MELNAPGDDRAETLTGIETTIQLSFDRALICDDRAETLTGIETPLDRIVAAYPDEATIGLKPLQGLKPIAFTGTIAPFRRRSG